MKRNKFSIRTIAYTGLLAALVFVGNYLRLKIFLPGGGDTAIHFGNMPCLLAGLLLGPVPGGLAAGIGAFLFDLFDPIYAPEAWITFINKFLLAFVCGLIAHWREKPLTMKRRSIAAIAGSVTYTVLYLIKVYADNIFVRLLAPQAALIALLPNLATSLVNATAACITAIPISLAVERAMKRSGLL